MATTLRYPHYDTAKHSEELFVNPDFIYNGSLKPYEDEADYIAPVKAIRLG